MLEPAMPDRNGRALADRKLSDGTAPFKYDIRVTGDLYADQRDNRTTTKVSVKILGNEDGDIIVEQDDARSLASPTLSADGDSRTPRITHKRLTDHGLELHIHALPTKQSHPPPPLPSETAIAGGGGSSCASGEDEEEAPASATSSFASEPMTRPATGASGFTRTQSRPISSHQSFMEIRPAFHDEAASDAGCLRSDGAQTPQSLELPTSPVLVGGGPLPPAFERRPRSSSMTMVEDKATQTTLRGLPDLAARSLTADYAEQTDCGSSRATSPVQSVLRGGGAMRLPGDSVFSAFSGPPVAPPEQYVCGGHRAARPRSLPRQQQRGRRASKDGVNYRERVESLLTQYFPDEILQKYLDDLRHRYRFMGPGGMTPSEITRLLDETTADSQLKEQLRADLEALSKVQMAEASQSDTEQTVASSSHPHYLSIRETELRDVLDRTSISPAPKASRHLGVATANLVGGGLSMETLPPSAPHSTLRSDRVCDHVSDHVSVAASVAPAESVRGSPPPKARTSSMPMPEQPAAAAAPAPHPATPSPERTAPPRPPHSDGPRRGGRQAAPESGYWEDDDKYRLQPPDMSKAFTILKSQPIFIREMASSDIKFQSPFSHPPAAAAAAARASSGSPSGPRRAAGSAASKRSAFAGRHPAESKVAKAVSELEEVLRRTEADTVESIERDLRSAGDCRQCPSCADDTAPAVSRDSLVGGGASSRATSVATRISALGGKYAARSDSASKLSDSQSTIRTDVLLKDGIEYGDADHIDDNDDDSTVPDEQSSRGGSALSLPMPVEDMPAELLAVLRRTGGLANARVRRMSTPPAVASASASVNGSVASKCASGLVASAPSAPPSVRSAAPAPVPAAPAADEGNCSLTELDIVLGRTGGAIGRASALSHSSAGSEAAGVELSGGSGSPRTGEAHDSDELASVLRRTKDFVPPISPSTRASSQASAARPESAASALKSVYPPDTLRAAPGDGSHRSGRSAAPAGLREQAAMAGHAPQQPQPQPRPSMRAAAAGPSTYAPSPLSGPAYQPADRRPPPEAAPAQDGNGDRASEAPSPPLYRLPTPVFGRFPSPPPYIKNRGQNQDADDSESQAGDQRVPAGPSHSRPHSQSVSQADPRAAAARPYPEEPVVDRLDLETGSLASRRSRPRTGSEFGSASTLMSGYSRDTFNLPKVVEEDIDSLASYPNSARGRSPALRGGGAGGEDPGTLRGGGRLHPAFEEPPEACAAGCCGVCGEGVGRSDVVVRPQVMHASCLRCEACDCLLTSSTFRAINGHVYCERDYQQFFSKAPANGSKVVAVRPGLSDKKFQAMNRAIMESFTSVDDFLLHMRQLREKGDQAAAATPAVDVYSGDPAQVQRAGDIGVDRQTHYEREQVTSPSGTPWIMERIVDKKTKTKVLEKRYPADASVKSAASARTAPVAAGEPTLLGGGGGLAVASAKAVAAAADPPCNGRSSAASRPSTALLNDTKDINGWEHPLCPVCSNVVYPNDRVTHEGYGYHRTCMRCQRCSQVTPAATAVRIKGAIYCKKHGTELLRRHSILMRKKSTMGRRSRQSRSRASVAASDRFVDPASIIESAAPPPVPPMPIHATVAAQKPVDSQPRRVTTALRNFLEAAAEQIDSGSPPMPELTTKHSAPSSAPSSTSGSSAGRRPLPVPQPRPGQAKQQQQQQQPLPPRQKHRPAQPASPLSIFAGSRDSLYDSNVVNALRMEAQRQINGSQVSIAAAAASPKTPADRDVRQMLSPCGPSIADGLNKLRPNSVSSQFDPFEASQIHLAGGGFGSPLQQQQPPAFAPNAQMDNLERRFRNANFRPPWALTSQSTFQL